jgi:hypothetical protein
VVSFPQVFPPTYCVRLSSPHSCYMPRPSHSSRFVQPNKIWLGLLIIKLLIMYISPFPCHLVRLRPKYSPQYLILRHPQATFLLQCERPSFKPIQKQEDILLVEEYTLAVCHCEKTSKEEITPFFYQSAGRQISPLHILEYHKRESLIYTAILLRYFATQSNSDLRRCCLKVKFEM